MSLLVARRGSLGKGASFTPALIPGLTTWYDASQITGKSDGDGVSQWNDLAGGARHMVQATGSKQPVYKTNILNGLPVLRLDGTDDGMEYNAGSAFLTGAAASVFAVYVPRGAGSADARIVSAQSVAGNEFTNTTSAIFVELSNGNTAGPYSTASYYNLSRYVAATLVPTGTARQSTTILSGTSLSMWQDGTADPVAQVVTSPAFNIQRLWLSGNGTSGSTFNGDVAEVLVYNAALSTADRLTVEAYLRRKWTTPAAFTPASVGGLVGWWDMSLEGYADLDPVSSVTDRTGGGRNMVQATGSKQPTNVRNSFGSQTGVRMNGTDDFLEYLGGADFITGSGLSFLATWKRNVSVNDAAVASVVANADTVDSATATSAVLGYSTNGTNIQDFRNGARSMSPTAPGLTVHQSAHIYDGTNNTLFIDGVGQTPVASTGSFAVRKLFLGARYGGSTQTNFNQNTYGEWMIFNTGISAADRARLVSYLREKWGTP